MADLNFTFNADEYTEEDIFTPLPEGWYDAYIAASEVRENNNKTGYYTKLTFQVIGEKYRGRILFGYINHIHQNDKVQAIGRQQLSSICKATGQLVIEDSSQLHGIPMQIKVKIRPAEGNYSSSNEVKGFRKIGNPVVPENTVKINNEPPNGWVKNNSDDEIPF